MHNQKHLEWKTCKLTKSKKLCFWVICIALLLLFSSIVIEYRESIMGRLNINKVITCALIQLVIFVVIIFALTAYDRITNNYEKILRYDAYHDSLTGLPNRSVLIDQISCAIMNAPSGNRKLAVMFLDLDNFKMVNDTLGHDYGDLLLQIVIKRLKGCLHEEDIISRHGGDEFVILLTDISQEDAENVAQRIVGILGKPFSFDGHEFLITSSIGISMYPEDGETPNALIKSADTAMYAAKRKRKSSYAFYSSSMGSHPDVKITGDEIRNALTNGEFSLYYQPVVDICKNTVSGAEALIRWNHPRMGMIYPDEFLPLAERYGLMTQIDEWVLKTVFRQIRAWDGILKKPFQMSANISESEFLEGNLTESIAMASKENDIEAGLLEIEIKQSTLKDVGEAATIMQKLKGTGVKIMVDNFGATCWSYKLLRDLPIDAIKIDSSFIQDVSTCSKDTAIAGSIITLGRDLNMDVIMKGVEDENLLAFLKQYDGIKAQGYLPGRPMPPQMFEHEFNKLNAASL